MPKAPLRTFAGMRNSGSMLSTGLSMAARSDSKCRTARRRSESLRASPCCRTQKRRDDARKRNRAQRSARNQQHLERDQCASPSAEKQRVFFRRAQCDAKRPMDQQREQQKNSDHAGQAPFFGYRAATPDPYVRRESRWDLPIPGPDPTDLLLQTPTTNAPADRRRAHRCSTARATSKRVPLPCAACRDDSR